MTIMLVANVALIYTEKYFFFCMRRETYLPEGQCRIPIACLHALGIVVSKVLLVDKRVSLL